MPRKDEAFGIANNYNAQEARTNNELYWGERDAHPRIGDFSQQIHAGDPKLPVEAETGLVLKVVRPRCRL
jgi:hypothetical protein